MGLVLPGLGILPYRVEEEPNQSGMTALGGLPAYLDLASVLTVREELKDRHFVRWVRETYRTHRPAPVADAVA